MTRPARPLRPRRPIHILFATGNPGKAREVRRILNWGERRRTKDENAAFLSPHASFEILTPSDLELRFDVAETGSTFEENARLKAQAAWRLMKDRATAHPSLLSLLPADLAWFCLADDSGLEVDALDGKPGVHSARFMGEGSSFRKKYLEVLRLMTGIPDARRTARFRCCAVLLSAPPPSSPVNHVFQGVCEGRIALEPRGTGGFGYDPIFIPEGYDRTFGELPAEIKNRISHRSQAFRQVREYLARREVQRPRTQDQIKE